MAIQTWRIATFHDAAAWVDVTVDDAALIIQTVSWSNQSPSTVTLALTDSRGRALTVTAQPGGSGSHQLTAQEQGRYPLVRDASDGSITFGFDFSFQT